MTIRWRTIRLSLLIASFAFALHSGIFDPGMNELRAVTTSAWANMALGFLFFAPIALALVIGVQAINPFSAKVWTRPTHDSNPFQLRNPLAFFHFGAYFTLAGALGYVAAGVQSGMHVLCWGLALACGAVGLLAGVQLCQFLFKRRFQQGSS